MSKSTQISISQVSNGSPNGNGLAYRLEEREQVLQEIGKETDRLNKIFTNK